MDEESGEEESSDEDGPPEEDEWISILIIINLFWPSHILAQDISCIDWILHSQCTLDVEDTRIWKVYSSNKAHIVARAYRPMIIDPTYIAFPVILFVVFFHLFELFFFKYLLYILESNIRFAWRLGAFNELELWNDWSTYFDHCGEIRYAPCFSEWCNIWAFLEGNGIYKHSAKCLALSSHYHLYNPVVFSLWKYDLFCQLTDTSLILALALWRHGLASTFPSFRCYCVNSFNSPNLVNSSPVPLSL